VNRIPQPGLALCATLAVQVLVTLALSSAALNASRRGRADTARYRPHPI